MTAWKWILLFVGLVLSFLFLVEEFRFSFYGKIARAQIISESKEFAGFSQRNDGSSATYRKKIEYEFTGETETVIGTTTANQMDGRNDELQVRYMVGLPSKHRVITSHFIRFQIIKIVLFASFLSWVIVLLSSTMKNRHRENLQN